jgi:hypothetical protein
MVLCIEKFSPWKMDREKLGRCFPGDNRQILPLVQLPLKDTLGKRLIMSAADRRSQAAMIIPSPWFELKGSTQKGGGCFPGNNRQFHPTTRTPFGDCLSQELFTGFSHQKSTALQTPSTM